MYLTVQAQQGMSSGISLTHIVPLKAVHVHTLNSVRFSCDRVLVLDKGQIAEFDTPTNLIAQKGIFYGMAKDAGLV